MTDEPGQGRHMSSGRQRYQATGLDGECMLEVQNIVELPGSAPDPPSGDVPTASAAGSRVGIPAPAQVPASAQMDASGQAPAMAQVPALVGIEPRGQVLTPGKDGSSQPGHAQVRIDIAAVPDDGREGDGNRGEQDSGPDAAVTQDQERAGETDWRRHRDGRWVVGDAGSQPRVVALATRRHSGAPVDTEIDGASVGRVAYRAASLRGFSHQESGKPRQDAFAVRVTRSDGWLVACVADGVSDAPRSENAAKIAADTVARKLIAAVEGRPIPVVADEWRQVVEHLPWRDALAETNGEIVRQAREHLETIYRGKDDEAALVALPDPLPFSHARTLMATTAVALVMSTVPDPGGRYPYAVCVLAGDSAGYLIHGSRWRPLIAPKDSSAAIAVNGVRALPGLTEPVVRFARLAPGEALALLSDGVSDPLGQGEGVVGRFLLDQWQSPPSLLQFAEHVGFYRKTFADDRTAVVVWTPAEAS